MVEFILLLFVPLLSWLDRQRGTPEKDEFLPQWLALGLYALTVFVPLVLSGVGVYLSAGAAILLTANLKPGYGHPFGWAIDGKAKGKKESWQVGPLANNPWLALAVRGGWVGLPFLYFDWRLALALSASSLAGWCLAPLLARFIPVKGDKWSYSEYLRGAFVGIGLVVLT